MDGSIDRRAFYAVIERFFKELNGIFGGLVGSGPRVVTFVQDKVVQTKCRMQIVPENWPAFSRIDFTFDHHGDDRFSVSGEVLAQHVSLGKMPLEFPFEIAHPMDQEHFMIVSKFGNDAVKKQIDKYYHK